MVYIGSPVSYDMRMYVCSQSSCCAINILHNIPKYSDIINPILTTTTRPAPKSLSAHPYSLIPSHRTTPHSIPSHSYTHVTHHTSTHTRSCTRAHKFYVAGWAGREKKKNRRKGVVGGGELRAHIIHILTWLDGWTSMI